MLKVDYKLLLERLKRYSGPIEIHITVKLENTESAKRGFLDACKSNQGKAIWIELDKGETINQPMYGVRLNSTAEEYIKRIESLVDVFNQNFLVNRVKIEAGPKNMNIPKSSDEAKDEPIDCYFEHHVELRLDVGADLEKLKSDLSRYSGYVSRNAFKIETETGTHTRFVTQRFLNLGDGEADDKLAELISYVEDENIEIASVEREYNIFDSNFNLDNGWML